MRRYDNLSVSVSVCHRQPCKSGLLSEFRRFSDDFRHKIKCLTFVLAMYLPSYVVPYAYWCQLETFKPCIGLLSDVSDAAEYIR